MDFGAGIIDIIPRSTRVSRMVEYGSLLRGWLKFGAYIRYVTEAE